MKRTFTKKEWKSVTGATEKPKRLRLEENKDGLFVCPVQDCDSDAYKSQRGCRKHVSVKHGWYFFFEEKPKVEDSFPEAILQSKCRQKRGRCKTFDLPYFPENSKVARDFCDWISSAGGGGKDLTQSHQIRKKILKFAKFCCKDVDEGTEITKPILEYCIGSVKHIESFLKHIDEECEIGKPGVLSYLQSFSHALDFIRYQGMESSKISAFVTTEVYLSRAKQCLRKKIRVEWNSLLSIDYLESINCWASLSELQNVIPFYISKYKQIINLCTADAASSHDLSFATSFIVSLLFLNVKGSRPMTFQFLTMPMITSAFKCNYIDQSKFKTKEKYGFDSLIFNDETLQLIKQYTDFVRPKLSPSCEYLLVCKGGNQLSNLGDIFGRMVFQAIGKYINPTRYRQIIETESANLLSVEEQSVISLDQKHTSNVAQVHYKKRRSRDVAKRSTECIQKMLAIAQQENSCIPLENKNEEPELREANAPEENIKTISTETPDMRTDSKRRKKCPFTKEEDNFLIKGIKKYGQGRWTNILNDPEYKFHPSRKNSTLIMRAKAKKII